VLSIGVGEGSLRDGVVWAFLPKVLGVFVVCPSCGMIVPEWERCLECGKDITPSQNVPKGIVISSAEELKDLKGAELIIPEPNSFGRELYNTIIDSVQDAYNLTNDFGRVASALKKRSYSGLSDISLELGNPIKVMLALKVDSPEEGLERVGTPCLVDYKYDGFRMQIHKNRDEIRLFTRRLEEVTKQFAEVVEVVRENVKGDSFVLDGEAIGFDPITKRFRPFQEISQRIKRKHNIEELAAKLPVELDIFDVVFYNGKSLIKLPYKQRREMVERIVPQVKLKIQPSTAKIIERPDEAQKFFDQAINSGQEGIMFKNLSAPYKPGGRVGYIVKFKPSADTIDLVIVGAEYGEGKRATWLTSYDLACIKGDEFLKIGKASTGLKEKPEEGLSFSDMTELLKPLIISSKGKHVTVRPEVVVEVGYQEIQKSPTNTSGFAMRFPRIVRLREDKAVDEIASRDDIKGTHKKQSR
jgi:DNA ligase-1